MARFVFAYENLKKFRSNRLLMARKDMFAAEGKVRDLADKLRQAIDSRALALDLRDGLLSQGSLDQLPPALVEGQTTKIRLLQAELLTAEQEFERHRNWVAHLGRELKIVEKLEEKRRQAWQEDERTAEKRRADAWVAENWSRQQMDENRVHGPGSEGGQR